MREYRKRSKDPWNFLKNIGKPINNKPINRNPKIILRISQEELNLLFELHTELCNRRLKKEKTNIFLDILRRS